MIGWAKMAMHLRTWLIAHFLAMANSIRYRDNSRRAKGILNTSPLDTLHLGTHTEAEGDIQASTGGKQTNTEFTKNTGRRRFTGWGNALPLPPLLVSHIAFSFYNCFIVSSLAGIGESSLIQIIPQTFKNWHLMP